jgi:hypothetical protein
LGRESRAYAPARCSARRASNSETTSKSSKPSGGDRVFVVTKGGTTVEVVDRYREEISGKIDLGRHASELRVDALGRYLLAHEDGVDSVLVIALAPIA